MVKSNAMLSPRIAEGLPLNNFKSWKFSWMLSADTRTLLKHNLKGPVKLKMWNGTNYVTVPFTTFSTHLVDNSWGKDNISEEKTSILEMTESF
jgi:hypothetical protein